MANGSLPARQRRLALTQLSRERLIELTTRYGLDVGDRRRIENHVEALVKAASVDFSELLQSLKRDELKAICGALGLDAGGKEKELLVERILASAGKGDDEGTREPLTLTAAESESKRRKPRDSPSTPRASGNGPTADYRHDATRKNNPPAGLIDLDRPPPQPKKTYSYDPHLDPQLQWSGKAEHTSFEVDTVSLHIHERISTQAIMRAVRREDAQRDLFADTALPESKAIDFYAHDIGWANRLILGDSLLVMNSLLEREQMAGKVQCIYLDPPYGVSFNSNFQPSVRNKDVKDADDASLTREPEQIQAYRDTWKLGVHSYLTYLRDRFHIARELLGETGSIFVQISTDNLHLVSVLLDEVFGPKNRIELISFRKKTMPLGGRLLEGNCDYLVWYAKNKEVVKFRTLFEGGSVEGDAHWNYVELPDGTRRQMTREEIDNHRLLPKEADVYQLISLYPTGTFATGLYDFTFEGRTYRPPQGRCWKTPIEGMKRLESARRLQPYSDGETLRYVLKFSDYPVSPLGNVWADTSAPSDKTYVVQTNTRVVERCLLMATDPGDLVLDPTCGSGTTAFVAEQWGRRWITCDTSRVALAIARQRLLTGRFPYYRLRSERVKDGFAYETVPHITLKSIAQNPKLDECKTLQDRERVVRETAEQEVLYDQPEQDGSKVRVSGPFTVEAIPVASMEDPDATELRAEDNRADSIGQPARGEGRIADVGGDYVSYMIDLLKKNGGVHFKNGRNLPLTTIRPLKTANEYVHAESETGIEGDPRRVAISFGPRHGPVTPKQILDAIQQTRGFDIVLFVGFACDPEAGKMIETGAQGRELHFVHAAPDILVKDLLKTSKATKLFTVFGLPDVKVKKGKDGEVTVELAGIDIYDPTTGETRHDEGESVAAWFLDHDYDGRTFLVCQALFPASTTKNPWEKLQKALKGSIDEDKFEALRSTTSLPFKPGKRIAVKVIDDRGNEVIKIVNVQGLR